jgi:predicted AAA+ superfamily ATPase
LAGDDAESLAWRTDFIETFLVRDLPQLGITIPGETLRHFWRMSAHLHGQLFNASQLAASLGGVAHTTVHHSCSGRARSRSHHVMQGFGHGLERFAAALAT